MANSGQPRAQPLNLRIELLVGVLVGVLREIAGRGEVTEDAPERYFVAFVPERRAWESAASAGATTSHEAGRRDDASSALDEWLATDSK